MDHIDAHAFNDAKVVSESSTVEVERRISEAIFEYEALTKAGVEPDLSIFLARYADIQDALRACIEAKNFVDGAFGSNSQEYRATPHTQPTRLGDFLVLQKVGSGGMGEVYEAYEISLARRVALKVLAKSLSSDDRSLKRFQHEAQAAATLQHPHIVPVYSVGSIDKYYFYAMQFIDGASVAELLLRFQNRYPNVRDTIRVSASETPNQSTAIHAIDRLASFDQLSQGSLGSGDGNSSKLEHHPLLHLMPGSPEYFRAVARLIQQAAEALQHAHDNGIIHRDIKPSNLLIDLNGNAWVADFGLARLPESNLTVNSDLLGTVRYMSPEQASGHTMALDGRTDVYSLGATLYEMLTLKPLFEADDRRGLLRKVVELEPISPRQVVQELPRDLETITRKALSKELNLRYVSAAAMAEDLERFLSDRPINAVPPTVNQLLSKWMRRNRGIVVGMTGLTVVILLIATVATAMALNRISNANQNAIDANAQLSKVLDAKDLALYRANMILARRDWDNGSHDGARARLDATSERHRMWEWHYLNSICQAPTVVLHQLNSKDFPCAISPAGDRILYCKLWQSEVSLTIQSLPIWGRTQGSILSFKPKDNGFEFNNGRGYRFCNSGQYAAAIDNDNTVSVMNTQSGELVHLLVAPFRIQGALAVEDDGNVLAPLMVGGRTEIWDLVNSEKLSTIEDTTPVACWSANLDRIFQKSGAIRDPYTGEQISKLKEQVRDAFMIGTHRFNPGGTLLAGGASNGIRVIDTKSGNELHHFADGDISYLTAFSPDGTRLATAGNDRYLRIYDLLSGKLIMQSQIDTPGSLVLAFQEDGSTLVTASSLQQKLWNCLDLVEGAVCSAKLPKALHGESEVFCEGQPGKSRVLQRIDARNHSVLETYEPPMNGVLDFEINPTAMVAALRTKSSILLWDLSSRRLITEFPSSPLTRMQFSNDGQWLIMNGGDSDAIVNLIDVVQGEIKQRFELDGKIAKCFHFNGDSSQVYVGYHTGEVVAWNTESGLRRWIATPHRQAVGAVAVDPSKRYVASAGEDEVIQILDINSGAFVRALKGHVSSIGALAFHPTEPRLVSGGSDDFIRIWDIETWEPIFQLPTRGHSNRLIFSPSGRTLYSFRATEVVSFGLQETRNREEQRKQWLYRSLTRAEHYKDSFASEWFLKRLMDIESDDTQLLARFAAVQSQVLDEKPTQRPTVRIGPPGNTTIENLSLQTLESAYLFAANRTLLGDSVSVKRAADSVVGQIDESSYGWIASLAYRLYLFCPGDPADIKAILPNFEEQTKAYQNKLAIHSLRGGLYYRAGENDQALKELMQAEQYDVNAAIHALNWLFLSMAHSQLGNIKEAEEFFDRANAWREAHNLANFSKIGYQVRVLFPVLKFEAEELLKEKRSALKLRLEKK